jgi:hypothetical protein
LLRIAASRLKLLESVTDPSQFYTLAHQTTRKKQRGIPEFLAYGLSRQTLPNHSYGLAGDSLPKGPAKAGRPLPLKYANYEKIPYWGNCQGFDLKKFGKGGIFWTWNKL